MLVSLALGAADLSWEFTSLDVWRQKDPILQHDFRELASNTNKGFHFFIDDKYHRITLEDFSYDPSVYPVIEVFHKGDNLAFSWAAYGEGEEGYDDDRLLRSEWPANERFYPERTTFQLSRMPRWQKGNIRQLQQIISNSGEGASTTITAMALRRGVDTLENGALLIRDAENQPAFWNFSDGMLVHMSRNEQLGYPVCEVSAGFVDTALDSLKPGHEYLASVFTCGDAVKIEALIYDRQGQVIGQTTLEPEKKDGTWRLWKASYLVPQEAYEGELQFTFAGPGGFADALVEDLGNGGPNWHAQWIWAQGERQNGQTCWFRREFVIDDPEKITSAFLQATCDDAFALEVNNNRIFNNNNWSNPLHSEVKQYLLKGKNVITAVGFNNTSYAGFLAELKLVYSDGETTYLGTDESWLWRSTDPGEHWRRVVPPAETEVGWANAQALGAPPVSPWDNKVRYYAEAPVAGEQFTVDQSVYATQKTTARINRDMSFPRIEINGEIATPMIFGLRPRGDATDSYKTIQASGFKLFRVGWEFSFEAWHENGEVDYSDLENKLTELLGAEPNAKVILMFRISPPSFWLEQHPKEIIRFADGSTTGADGVFASPASKVFRKEISAKVGEVVKHIEGSWYGSAIIGYMPCNLRGPEWVVPLRSNCYPDYSEPMKVYFREYLREKYITDRALQKAWNNPSVTLDNAQLPDEARRKPSDEYFLDNNCQDIFDYNRAVNRANVDTIADVLDAVHANAPDKLRVLYFGYLMTLDHTSKLPATSGHYDLSRLLAMNKVDVMASPTNYVWRKPGEPSCIGTVESSFAKHGVVWLQEADNRTYLSSASEDMLVNFHAKTSLRENWREFVCAMLKRQAIWFYELGGGWYDNPYFHEDFKKMLDLYQKSQTTPVTWQSPMACFFDEQVFDGVALSDGRWAEERPFCLAAASQRMAALCGIPYDIYELEDIYSLDLSPYKVLVFPNEWRNNPKLAGFLQENVYSAGKTVVWLYAPGFGQKGDLEGMKALTGFVFTKMPKKTPLAFFRRDGELLGSKGMYNGEAFTTKVSASQILGKYASGGTAAAWKKQGQGTSVWMSVHDASGNLLREVLKMSGVETLIDRGDRVLYDGTLLGVIAVDSPGLRTVTLPENHSGFVTDIISGEKFACEQGKFQFFATPGDVRLFQMTAENEKHH